MSAAAAFVLFAISFGWFNRAWLRQMHDSIAVISSRGPDLADTELIVWVLNWVGLRLHSDFHRILDAPINHPTLRQLTGSEHFATSQLLFLPIEAATDNPLLAANLTALLTYPLTALSMFALLRAIGARTPAAVFAGFGLALGPLQVPGNLHILQMLPIFFPLTAIALHRLRDSPGLTRASLCTVALLAGLLSSFYTAMLVAAFFSVWVVVEGLRDGPGRARYAIGAVGSASVAGAAFMAVAWTYLQRPEVGPEVPMFWTPELLTTARHAVLVGLTGERGFGIGAALTSVALLGLISLSQADLRAYAVGCVATAAVGLFIGIGGIQQLAYADLPRPIGGIAMFVGRFFRVTPRGLLLTGFAFAFLGGLGLETLRRRFPRGAVAAFAIFLAFLLTTRGVGLSRSEIVEVRAFGAYQEAYQRIGIVIASASDDPGALLELPRDRRPGLADAEAMMGQILHGVPLITGHTGYLPANRPEVDRLTKTPIGHESIRSLVAMTGLRWILLRPRESWSEEQEHSLTVGQLRSFPELAGEYEVEGFHLFELPGRSN